MRVLALAGGALALTAQERPVSRVIKLLENMSAELEAEKAADAKTYQKMVCWCKETIPATEKSIDENQQCIETKTAEIQQFTGDIAKAKTQVSHLEKEIADETQQLADATAMREKEEDEFHATETELTEAITALKSAVAVLQKHQGNFLQTDAQTLLPNVAKTISAALEKYSMESRVHAAITPSQRANLNKFLQQPTFGAYQSQSGGVFGILSQMLDEFNEDLKQETENDAKSAAAFAETKKTKNQLIKMKNEELEAKKVYLGESQAALGDAQVALSGCQDGLEADQKTLADAQQSCQENEQEYADRSKAREEEIAAVGQALAFLNSDEAHDLFARTFSFVQTHFQNAMMQKIRAAATGPHAAQIMALAQEIPKGTFTKVIRAIDEMTEDIKAEMAADVAAKDNCVETLHQLKTDLQDLNNTKTSKGAKLAATEEKIEQLKTDMATFKEEIAEATKSMKEASAVREEANADFQKTVQDQSASIKVLNKALEVLANVYAPKSLMQQPAGFKAHEQNGGGNKVLSMIQNIIADAEKDKALSIQNENNAQAKYEEFTKATNELIATTTNQYNTAKGQKAEAEELAMALEEDVKNLSNEIVSKETAQKATQDECDFLLKNFASRQEKMDEEVQALAEAKSYLQGMQ